MLTAVLAAFLLGALSLASLGWLPASGLPLTLVAIAGSVGSFALLRSPPARWFLGTLAATVAWSALLAPRVEAPALVAGGGRVQLSVDRGGCGTRGCYAEAEILSCEPLLGSAVCLASGTRVGVASAHELPAGARVTAVARFKPRAVFHDPIEGPVHWPDTRPVVQATLEPGSDPRVDHVSWLDARVHEARRRIRVAITTSLREPHAGVARALLLGEGSAVERELNDAIRSAGVSHVLAVSGMHVTLLVGVLVALIRALWLRTPLALYVRAERAAAGVGVALAPLVAKVCGGSPSAVRAAWTSTLMYLLVALGLRPAALPVAAFVVMVHATLCPRDALHPGFVLSVLATAALLTHVAAPRGRPLVAALRESMRAWLSTAPFLLVCFGQLSLVALAANVALLPLGTLLVPLAATHVLNVAAGLGAWLPTSGVFEVASAAFVQAARVCADLDPKLSFPAPTAWQVVAALVLACTWMVPLPLRVRAWASCAALSVVATSEWHVRHALAEDQVRITFLDVGQGDAALIETGTGQRALIDAGGAVGGGPDPGALAVVPALRARRVDALDLVVLSHPHPDHYGGLSAVLDGVPVRTLWDTGQAEAEDLDPGAVARLLARARERGTQIARPDQLCGRDHRLGAVQIEVLAPCPSFDIARGANDNSFVLRLVHGGRSILFTGDVERAAETSLTEEGARLRSDVLKVGHHGSRTSSASLFLAAVSPWIAVISAGRGNGFGHPHVEALSRLAHVPHVARTDRDGGIELLSDGRTITMRTALDGQRFVGPP